MTLRIDGKLIYAGPGGQRFDKMSIVIGGPSWRPARTFQFDDFEFVSQPATPALDLHMYAGLTITGSAGAPYQIQSKNSLNSTNWLPLADLVLPTSPYFFVDTNSPNSSQRFYRAVPKP